jgi:hypothetical protein
MQAANQAGNGGPEQRVVGWQLALSRASGAVNAFSSLLARHRWLRLGLQLAVLLACLAYLALNLRDAGDLLARLRPDWLLLLAAWILTTAAVYLGALAWWFTLLALGLQAGLLASLRVHLQSNLVKYLPGYAWQLVGKAYLSRRMGLPVGQVGLALAIELAQLAASGALLAAWLFPQSLLSRWIATPRLVEQLSQLRWIAPVLLAALVLIVPLGLEALRRRGYRALAGLRPGWYVASLSAVVAGWMLFGLAFWCLGAALVPLSTSSLGLFIFTLASSVLLGLAVLFVPGGLGVRESIMVYVLSVAGLTPAMAVVTAALSRLSVLLAELAGAFFLETGLRLGKKQPPAGRIPQKDY